MTVGKSTACLVDIQSMELLCDFLMVRFRFDVGVVPEADSTTSPSRVCISAVALSGAGALGLVAFLYRSFAIAQSIVAWAAISNLQHNRYSDTGNCANMQDCQFDVIQARTGRLSSPPSRVATVRPSPLDRSEAALLGHHRPTSLLLLYSLASLANGIATAAAYTCVGAGELDHSSDSSSFVHRRPRCRLILRGSRIVR
eukprot:scaffold270_cov390-Prasinococcus_capsulatus_cf.AAC.10